MTFSVIVLTCNRAARLEACLEALLAQSRPPDEIIVADTGSTDDTPRVLGSCASRLAASPSRTSLRVVHIDAGRGWAGVRNDAAREASSQWIAFTDDDCVPARDWLERIAAHADRGLDAVGGLVEPPDDMRPPWWWHPDMGWAAGLSVPGHHGPDAGRVYYPQTANWAMRRAVLLREPFQEIQEAALADGDNPAGASGVARRKRLYLGGREDAELWRRLRLHGWRTGFDAAMRVTHHIPMERFRFGAVLHRAFQDGVAAQRRDPRRALIEWAVGDIVRTPGSLLRGVFAGRRAPWREAGRSLTWGARQIGQCAGWVQQRDRFAGIGMLTLMALRTMSGIVVGEAKSTARRIQVAARRTVRRPAPSSAPPRRILVLAAGYVGDMALLQPFFTTLKAQRPEVEITLVTGSSGEAIYRNDPALSSIHILGGREPDANQGGERALKRLLEDLRPEAALAPYCYGISPRPLFEMRDLRVVTFCEEVGFARRLWYDLADVRVPKPPGRSEGGNLFRLFREVGLVGRLMHSPLAFEPDEALAVRTALQDQGLNSRNLVIIAPGSAKTSKLWREDRWAEVVRHLARDYGLRVALAGSPEEESLCGEIAERSGCEPLVWCRAGLRGLTLRLSSARLLVCTDNGLRYLAAAMDTPTLALFGPTDERQWRPIAEPLKHGVVRACPWDLTLEERAGLPESYQMDRISVEQVRPALDEMLRDDF